MDRFTCLKASDVFISSEGEESSSDDEDEEDDDGDDVDNEDEDNVGEEEEEPSSPVAVESPRTIDNEVHEDFIDEDSAVVEEFDSEVSEVLRL